MNKQGFTTVELILTLVLVITIMVSITSVTYTYRDRSRYEEILTEITDYKNMLTKIIYDDILDVNNPAIELRKISSTEYDIIRTSGTIKLKVINENNKVGIQYNDVDYIIPNSNKIIFKGTTTYPDDYPGRENTGLYSLDIVFSHKSLEEEFKIHFVISK